MTVVVDLGSATHGEHESVTHLTARFSPSLYWAFDPLGVNKRDETDVCDFRYVAAAAWTSSGIISLGVGTDGMNATVMEDKSTRGEWKRSIIVPCFDFSTFVAFAEKIDVVKMDIEGAEYPVLEKMVAEGTDRKIGLLLIEWHDHLASDYTPRRLNLLNALHCEWDGWA